MNRRIVLVDIGSGLVLSGVLSSAALFSAYSAKLSARGGVVPYTYSIGSGVLPDGLFLDAGTGIISGTTSAPGTSTFTVRVTDLSGAFLDRQFSITVIAEPLLLAGDAPDGQVGTPYSFNYTASGGVPPYMFDIASGVLPAGLMIDADTGALTGTPTNAGSVFWTVRVTDTEGATTITDGAVISYETLTLSGAYAAATTGSAYSSDLTIAGGDGTYSNARMTVGSVPAGLSLSIVSGKLRLSGTPTTAATSTFTVAVDSADGQTATSAQSVVVSVGWLYSSDGSTLAGWTASGGGGASTVDGVVGHPAPSVKVLTGSLLYRNVPGATRWKIDMRTPSVCDFQFMCNSVGVGPVFRLECRSPFFCGLSVGSSWGIATTPASTSRFTNRTVNTWYTYEIIYNSTTHTVDVLENGVMVLSAIPVPFPFNGDYIAINGDGAGPASNFDNIFIS